MTKIRGRSCWETLPGEIWKYNTDLQEPGDPDRCRAFIYEYDFEGPGYSVGEVLCREAEPRASVVSFEGATSNVLGEVTSIALAPENRSIRLQPRLGGCR